MRISTQQIQQAGIDSILGQQARLSHTQQQVATGKRILAPSDDPVGTSQLLQLRQSLETTKQYQANAQSALNRLTLEEGVLEGVGNILQRLRELAIQGNNATQNTETRRYMAVEVRQRLAELLGLANTRDGAGDYLFAGTKGSTEPFAASGAGGYVYLGDQTQRCLQIGSGRQVADGDTGAAVFQRVRNGNGTFVTEAGASNAGTAVIDAGSVDGGFQPALTHGNGYTLRFVQASPADPVTWEVFETGEPAPPTILATGNYTPEESITFMGARISVSGVPADGDTFTIRSSEYQDIFQTVADLATALEESVTTAQGQAQLNNRINRALADLDQGIGNILVVRANVGARLNAIESQIHVNDGYLLQTTETLSTVEDLDYAEAISRLNLQIAGLQAAQATYVKVNGLTIFDYL